MTYGVAYNLLQSITNLKNQKLPLTSTMSLVGLQDSIIKDAKFIACDTERLTKAQEMFTFNTQEGVTQEDKDAKIKEINTFLEELSNVELLIVEPRLYLQIRGSGNILTANEIITLRDYLGDGFIIHDLDQDGLQVAI